MLLRKTSEQRRSPIPERAVVNRFMIHSRWCRESVTVRLSVVLLSFSLSHRLWLGEPYFSDFPTQRLMFPAGTAWSISILGIVEKEQSSKAGAEWPGDSDLHPSCSANSSEVLLSIKSLMQKVDLAIVCIR